MPARRALDPGTWNGAMTTRSHSSGTRRSLAALAPALLPLLTLLVLMTTACATQPVKREPAVYFPPAPALPRLQFLTAFNGLKDIEEQSGFNRFVVGEKLNLELDKPYGVAIHDGKIYVCDTNTTVIVLDLEKKLFSSMAGAVGPGRLTQPVNISIEPDGTKYVSDPVRGQVVVFDRDDAYLRAIGEPGSWKPVDAVPYGDRLYVADNANGLVKVFDKLDRRVAEDDRRQGRPGRPARPADQPRFRPEGRSLRHRHRPLPGASGSIATGTSSRRSARSATRRGTSRDRRAWRSTARAGSMPSTRRSTTCRSSVPKVAC